MNFRVAAPELVKPSTGPIRAAWREGLQTGLPTLFGIGAWGMVVGVAMVKSGLTVVQASGMTLIAFAGSAQLASLPLIAAGAPIWVIFATALVVNLRFVIFSALLGPHFAHLPLRQRFIFGYISGDVSTALFLQRYPTPAPRARQAVLPERPDDPELVRLADRFARRHVPGQRRAGRVAAGLCRHAGDPVHHGAAGRQQRGRCAACWWRPSSACWRTACRTSWACCWPCCSAWAPPWRARNAGARRKVRHG